MSTRSWRRILTLIVASIAIVIVTTLGAALLGALWFINSCQHSLEGGPVGELVTGARRKLIKEPVARGSYVVLSNYVTVLTNTADSRVTILVSPDDAREFATLEPLVDKAREECTRRTCWIWIWQDLGAYGMEGRERAIRRRAQTDFLQYINHAELTREQLQSLRPEEREVLYKRAWHFVGVFQDHRPFSPVKRVKLFPERDTREFAELRELLNDL